MLTPSRQPSRSSSSGTGSVITMSEATVTNARRSSRSRPLQAFIAITTRCARTDPRGGAHDRRPRALERPHRRALEDLDPALARDPQQAAREQRRLDRRRGRLEDAGEVAVGAAAPHEVVGLDRRERRLAVALDRRDRRVPGAELRRVGRGPEPAVVAEAGVDALRRRRTAPISATASAERRASHIAPSPPQARSSPMK